MLASKITDLKNIRYPVLASPKFDGIRALTINGILVSRNLKPIPNDHIRNLAKGLPDGLDGELILDDGSVAGAHFSATSSAVMRQDGTPDVKYYVFDYVISIGVQALARTIDLVGLTQSGLTPKHKAFIKFVNQKTISNEKELLEYEEDCLDLEFEGVILRSPTSPYKEGRSTEREGYLLKLKRFEDSEATIVGFEEQMHNDNKAEEDLLGHTKRSSCKANMIPAGTLGKLYVIDVKSKIEFEIGTGFDAPLRQEIWNHKNKYLNTTVKYKYQSCGMKDKPRFPVFLGFRAKGDM